MGAGARYGLLTLRFETEPGGQIQVDFGVVQVEHADGRVRKYFPFALILDYSLMLYAEIGRTLLLRSDGSDRALACPEPAEGIPWPRV